MANEEHLKILKQGVSAWNWWREENPDIDPDLEGVQLSEAGLASADMEEANLRRADLSGANISDTDLSAADLRDADLSRTDLEKAWLIEADLRRASLDRADLSLANLSEANLSGAGLSEAYLIIANLNGADLSRASLVRALLIGTNLSGADLSQASLNGANLSKANLSEANLMEAHLSAVNLLQADLSGADLSGADLTGAYLSGVDLSGADLSEAKVGWSTFGNVDFSTVKGLETVKHEGPSTIGIDTIHLSKGNIPEVFLRGAGVPDTFIEYMASLVGKPIEFYSCFISYSSQDQGFAERLHNNLQDEGVRCWFAPEDMKIGDRIRPTIDQAVRSYDKLLIVLSEHSIDSDWVEKEVETAFEEERKRKTTILFPIRLDSAVMETAQAWAADIRRTRHIGDFTNWKDHDAYQKAFDRLLRDLKAEEGVEAHT